MESSISKFQFQKPVLTKLSFEVNQDFDRSQNNQALMQIGIQANTTRSNDAPEAVVQITVTVGEKSEKCPFWIEAVESSTFHWDKSLDSNTIDVLLNQNAPALLISYIRPTLALITSASPFNSFDLPYIDVTKPLQSPANNH